MKFSDESIRRFLYELASKNTIASKVYAIAYISPSDFYLYKQQCSFIG